MREFVDALKANGGALRVGGFVVKYEGTFPYSVSPQPEDSTEKE